MFFGTQRANLLITYQFDPENGDKIIINNLEATQTFELANKLFNNLGNNRVHFTTPSYNEEPLTDRIEISLQQFSSYEDMIERCFANMRIINDYSYVPALNGENSTVLEAWETAYRAFMEEFAATLIENENISAKRIDVPHNYDAEKFEKFCDSCRTLNQQAGRGFIITFDDWCRFFETRIQEFKKEHSTLSNQLITDFFDSKKFLMLQR